MPFILFCLSEYAKNHVGLYVNLVLNTNLAKIIFKVYKLVQYITLKTSLFS